MRSTNRVRQSLTFTNCPGGQAMLIPDTRSPFAKGTKFALTSRFRGLYPHGQPFLISIPARGLSDGTMNPPSGR